MKAKVNIPMELYNESYVPLLDAEQQYQIFFGGAAAGKSVFLAQRDVQDILKGGRNFLICRNTASTIRTSVFNEIIKIINDYNIRRFFKVNQTDFTITCSNGYQMLFGGLGGPEDPEKIKSKTPIRGVITDIRVEEATEISQQAFKQLEKRLRGLSDGLPKRITLSFNPIIKSHWIFKMFFSGVWDDEKVEYNTHELLIRKFTHHDNQFLEPSDRRALENEADGYMYDVYTAGKWGVIGGAIFRNWTVEDLSDRKNAFEEYYNGLDFGFTNPSAFVRCAYIPGKNEILVLQEALTSNMTNREIADALRDIVGDETVYCDSAEPKSINELQSYGISAFPVKKGQDSLLHGIQWLQQHKIIIDKTCLNLINEMQLYHHATNKYGEKQQKPVKAFDHYIDALRYATEQLQDFSFDFEVHRIF